MQQRQKLNDPDSRHRLRRRREGMAALEVVMTTVITFTILGFSAYWLIRISRVMFSIIGEMVGSPLM